MIDTRQELIIALRAASQLEHGLMAQYLFAGMTLKASDDPSLSQRQQVLITKWRQSIYEVARQEMGHLGTVQNLLSAVGGAPYFELPAFPTNAKYYDGQKFSLDPLTLNTVKRFVAFEAPQPQSSFESFNLIPDPLSYKTVGDLYEQILQGLIVLGDDAFIGAHNDQDRRQWSSSVEVHPVLDMESARRAIHDIIVEGEGTPTGGEDSHYHMFLRIEREFALELEQSQDFQPHRSVASNPCVLDSNNGVPITNLEAQEVAILFGSTYTTTLIALTQYYKFQEVEGIPVPNYNPQEFLRSTLIPGMMKSVIRPLGQDFLPKIAIDNDSGLFAGPTFEQLIAPDVPWNRNVVWKVLAERLKGEAAFAVEKSDAFPGFDRIASSLSMLAKNVNELKG